MKTVKFPYNIFATYESERFIIWIREFFSESYAWGNLGWLSKSSLFMLINLFIINHSTSDINIRCSMFTF